LIEMSDSKKGLLNTN